MLIPPQNVILLDQIQERHLNISPPECLSASTVSFRNILCKTWYSTKSESIWKLSKPKGLLYNGFQVSESKEDNTYLMVRSRSPTRYTACKNRCLSFFGHSNNSSLGTAGATSAISTKCNFLLPITKCSQHLKIYQNQNLETKHLILWNHVFLFQPHIQTYFSNR